MANLIEFLIVGRTPLGGALRAGLIGVLATALGKFLFTGFWAPLGLGAVVVLAMLPVAYALSRRDNPQLAETPSEAGQVPQVPQVPPGEQGGPGEPREGQ